MSPIFAPFRKKYKASSLNNPNPDLTQDLETPPLLEQTCSDDQEILIQSVSNPTSGSQVAPINEGKNPWNKLPDSWMLKGGILLLSIIFTPIALALSLVLMLVMLALTIATIVLCTAVALIVAPIIWIIKCLRPKKIEPLTYLDHINLAEETNEISEFTPLLSKNNTATQSPHFFGSLRQITEEEEITQTRSLYQKK